MKRVQLPYDWFGTPTWPPFHCLGHQYGHRDVTWKHSISHKLDEEFSFNSITSGFLVRKLGKQQIVPSFMRLDYEWFSGALAFRSLWGKIGTTSSLCVYKWKKKQTNKQIKNNNNKIKNIYIYRRQPKTQRRAACCRYNVMGVSYWGLIIS